MVISDKRKAIGLATGTFHVSKFGLLSDRYYFDLVEMLSAHRYVSESNWSDKGITTSRDRLRILRPFELVFVDSTISDNEGILHESQKFPSACVRREMIEKFKKSLERYYVNRDGEIVPFVRDLNSVGWHRYINTFVRASVIKFVPS